MLKGAHMHKCLVRKCEISNISGTILCNRTCRYNMEQNV